MMPEGESRHPWHSNWRGVYPEDAANNGAIGEHVVVVIIPLAGWAAR